MVNIATTGKPLSQGDSIRILGFFLKETGKFNIPVNRLTGQIEQILAMIRRITSKKRGLRELELCNVIETLIYCRVLYHLP